MAQAAGPFAGSLSGLHNTDCQMGFAASCEPLVGAIFQVRVQVLSLRHSAICVRERQPWRPGHCRRRQLDMLILLLGLPGIVVLRLLMSRRCLSGRNAEKIRKV